MSETVREMTYEEQIAKINYPARRRVGVTWRN